MIVITTPTGQIGHQVLNNLLNSDEPIRVIARDSSRLSPRVRECVQVVQGSHNDINVVTKAFAGADCVFWLVPPDPHADSVEDYCLDFTRPACEAIKRQGVKRVVAVSTLGQGVAKNAGQLSAAQAMDELIKSTGVSYRALRMPSFMENLLGQVESIKNQGMFFLAMSGDHKLLTCATPDIAAVAARLLLDGSWSGQDSVPVVGPDDLSPNDMAQIMSEVLQRPVRFQQVTNEAYKATLMQYGISEAWAQGLVDMAVAVDQGCYNNEPRTAQSTTSFRQWCEEVLKPAILA
ncbi:MAG TPA: NAD(P)H-binding protein [Ktedonobacteraceae bacterium]|nr:NAD(P)H-binding protein [Ktedonobacteraceae bacterium]